MGYTGGNSRDPDYYNLENHSEAIQVKYDPEVITYKDLLRIFWDSHDPFTATFSRQYQTAVFYHDDNQKKLAEESKESMASMGEKAVYTKIRPLNQFYSAENYHQKYMLRSSPALMVEFKELYSDVNDLVSSTAVARVNGYLGGNGSCDQLKSEISNFGLSEQGMEILLKAACGGNVDMSCSVKGCS